MLDIVKGFPSSFLVTSVSSNSRTLEVSPEVPMGHLSLENERATQDGACKCWYPGVGSGVVGSFRKAGRGGRVVRDNLFILGGGGGSVSRQVAPGHIFIRIVGNAHRAGNHPAFKQKCLLTLYGDRAGVGAEVSIWAIVEDRRVGFVGGL